MINADSMQLYRGMDIGTAKLTVARSADGAPHHLLDIWDVTQAASVSEYQSLARAGHRADPRPRPGSDPGGGSGPLHVCAAIDKLQFPGTPPPFARAPRHNSRPGSGRPGRAPGHGGPGRPPAILPSNGRRIVRGLEVLQLSGRPFSANSSLQYQSVYDPPSSSAWNWLQVRA